MGGKKEERKERGREEERRQVAMRQLSCDL